MLLEKISLILGLSLVFFSGTIAIFLGSRQENNRKGLILLLYGFIMYAIAFSSLLWIIPKLVE